MGTKTRALTEKEFPEYIRVILAAEGTALPVAAVCAVIIGTGARIGEVLNLTIGDVFDQTGRPLDSIIRTLEKKKCGYAVNRKDDRKQRLAAAFPWDVLGGPVIRWRKTIAERFVIPNSKSNLKLNLFSTRWSNQPLSRGYCWEINKHFLVKAEINPRGIGFHGIRKSFLSHMYFQRLRENSGDPMGALRYVQNLAGHTIFDTTLLYLSDCIARNHRDTMRAAFADLQL